VNKAQKGLPEMFRDWLLSDLNIKTNLILKEVWKMSAAFDLMESKIIELKTVNDSVLALITQLVANVAGATTLAEVQQIVAELDAEKTRLVAAVTANTPVA
jgi:hypothetical protein